MVRAERLALLVSTSFTECWFARFPQQEFGDYIYTPFLSYNA
jgi:hypothetical protein